MSSVEILRQVPAWNPPTRDCTLSYRSGGRKFTRQVKVGRPTQFDEIIVTRRRLERQWPRHYHFSAGTLRQLASSSVREVHRVARRCLASVELSGPILDLRMLEQPNNAAHILLHMVPLCLYAQSTLSQPMTCLFRRTLEPFRTLFLKFGVTPVFANAPVSGNFVQIFGTRGLAVYDLHSVFDCESIAFFPDTYDRFSPVVPSPLATDRLFVARRGPRALINHKTVEAFLSARGYTTVYFEDYSIDQQCALGAAAGDVVAIHGAAMSFFVLATRLKSIVELLPPQIYHQLFAVGLPQSIPDYKVIIPDFNPEIAYQPFSDLVKIKNAPFEADMSLLEDAVSSR